MTSTPPPLELVPTPAVRAGPTAPMGVQPDGIRSVFGVLPLRLSSRPGTALSVAPTHSVNSPGVATWASALEISWPEARQPRAKATLRERATVIFFML